MRLCETLFQQVLYRPVQKSKIAREMGISVCVKISMLLKQH